MAVNCDLNSGQGQVCGNECFDIVKSSQTYTVPCTKSVREAYTVNVAKQKAFTVNKQVPYIDYEMQTKQVPYQYMDRQTVTRNVPTCRTVPMIKRVCTTVPTRRGPLGFGLGRRCYVKKMCPRTVYVNQKSCAQRRFCQSIPRTGWRTVQKSVPVKKFRNETEVKYKTETVPEVRYRTRTVTKMVNKTVPVYNVVTKPQAPAQQQDVLVGVIPAPQEQTVLPPVTINSGPAIAYSGALNSSGVADAPAIVPEIKPDIMTSFNGYKGIQQANYDAAAAISDFNRIDKSGDAMLSYNEIVFGNADGNKDGVLNINEYKEGYGNQNTNMYGNGVYGNQNTKTCGNGVSMSVEVER